ncbi:neuroglian isoform X3 [Neocloeon triangulifer]|uniref:neuroglian isoform X3 n=1 Tax=Neocloeon triangulifer TaxID=2078957 RepID=UPI00286F8778|nr:neuroglian isoform X3 [Neocloeon triangulifer]
MAFDTRVLVVVLFLVTKFSRAQPSMDELSEVDKPIPSTSVEGVLGRRGTLPCNIEPSERSDSVYMVLWFKEADGEPLYSYDLRGRKVGNAKLWSSPNVFGPRARFQTETTPAVLQVEGLLVEDEGVYRCRVDFRNSPTRNVKINLTVIVPPERPVIFDAKRRDRTKILEPYNEGSDVHLICEVSGGRPKPELKWFLENTLIDDSYEYKPGDVTVNRLVFPNIGRQHLNSRLICLASNTNLNEPAMKAVVLDINLKPIAVNIVTKEKHVSADKRYEVECKASGSRPEAVITWWKGSRQIKRITKNFAEDGNHTISILTFVPGIDDDGKYLTCRAENPSIPESALEDKWRLDVHYAPLITLKMGSTLNADDIKEGDDVYFECHIKANPKIYKKTWFHNNREIVQNVSAGVIISDNSLVLQGVTRFNAGYYTCMATNAEGKGNSNPVELRIMCRPFPLTNCSITNQTVDSLTVDCVEGFDGGLPQYFLVEVLEVPERRLRHNATSRFPTFTLHGLEPGLNFMLQLYAANAKGRSEATLIEGLSVKGVAKFTGPTAAWPVNPVLGALVVTAILLLLIVFAVLVALYKRHQKPSRNGSAVVCKAPPPCNNGGGIVMEARRVENDESAGQLLPTGTPVGGGDTDTDPDVIPSKHERRPLKGFMKMYKTPPQRRRKKTDSPQEMVAAELEAAAEVDAELSMAAAHEQRMLGVACSGTSINHLANNISSTGTLSRVHKGVSASPTSSNDDRLLIDSLHALELVASSRMQESCI